jgi:23S rRNA pseudouridine1911/1915/1917 synthase
MLSKEQTKQAHNFLVEGHQVGQRLDRFLADQVTWTSRIRIGRAIANGDCLLNAQVARPGMKLSAGDSVSIQLPELIFSSMTPESLPLAILFEDKDLIVVDKPAGMLVHPTQGVKSGTLANALSYHLNQRNTGPGAGSGRDVVLGETMPVVRPGIVHRLDRATSGLMVVAKNQRALSILSRHFHKKLVEKRYIAVVDGIPRETVLAISAPIGRDENGPPFWRVMETGRYAETRLRVMFRGKSSAVVELEPVTGRTNQLRIHCAHIGHPIAGDDWYGGPSGDRLCLHAAKLGFHHPSGGDWLEFRSPIPIEIDEVFRKGT